MSIWLDAVSFIYWNRCERNAGWVACDVPVLAVLLVLVLDSFVFLNLFFRPLKSLPPHLMPKTKWEKVGLHIAFFWMDCSSCSSGTHRTLLLTLPDLLTMFIKCFFFFFF